MNDAVPQKNLKLFPTASKRTVHPNGKPEIGRRLIIYSLNYNHFCCRDSRGLMHGLIMSCSLARQLTLEILGV